MSVGSHMILHSSNKSMSSSHTLTREQLTVTAAFSPTSKGNGSYPRGAGLFTQYQYVIFYCQYRLFKKPLLTSSWATLRWQKIPLWQTVSTMHMIAAHRKELCRDSSMEKIGPAGQKPLCSLLNAVSVSRFKLLTKNASPIVCECVSKKMWMKVRPRETE